MKVLAQAVLMFSLLGVTLGQNPMDPVAAPDVVVVKNEWRKLVRNPALDDDPLRAGRETVEFENAKRETARLNQVLNDLGRDPIPPPTRSSSGMRHGDPEVRYDYKAKIRNNGTQTVRAVVWHYSFFDADKKEEVGRTSCTSKVNLRPGKTADLIGTSKELPISVVDVSQSGKDIKGAYAERVVITRLEYSDGSFWQRPVD